MHFARIVLRVVSTNLFRLSILSLPPLIAVVVVLGTPDHLKQALKTSGIYNSFVGAVLDQSTAKNMDAETKAFLNDPGVQSAVNKSFTPGVLQSYTEQVIDGTYNWLEGKTPQPQFAIDLGAPKQQLIANLTGYAKQRIEVLPPCTAAQIKQLPANTTILDLTCRPPGLDAAKAAKQFSSDITNNTNFLDSQKVTAADMPKDQSGQTIFQQGSSIPKLYQQLMHGPWILGGIAAITAILALLAHDQKRAGVKSLAWALLGSGIFWILGAIVYSFAFHKLAYITPSADSNALRQPVMALITSIAASLTRINGIVALMYIVMGAGGLLVLRLTRQNPSIQTTPAFAVANHPDIGTSAAVNHQQAVTSQSDITHKGEY